LFVSIKSPIFATTDIGDLILKIIIMKKKFIYIGMICLSIIMTSWITNKDGIAFKDIANIPESIKMYLYIEEFSNKYNIPKNIAYGIPHYESGYNGPADTGYNPKLVSKHGAYGAMQIKPTTANFISDTFITKKELLTNTKLNVEVSFKLLRYLYDKYHTWPLAVGAYNSGKPIINKYSKKVTTFNYNKIITESNKL